MTFPFPLFSNFSSLKVLFHIAIILIIIILIKISIINIDHKNFENFENNDISKFFLFNLITQKKGIYEGFSQDKSFILKQDNNIYDDFYIEIYDNLNNTIKRTQYDIKKIIDITYLNNEIAYLLDVGCGTGCLVNEFIKKGIDIIGIDKSQNMINYSNNKYNHNVLKNNISPIIYQCIEAENPIIYERSTFSHILCLYMTIYEIKDKIKFFRNAFYGLQLDGYLIIHLTKGNDDIIDDGNFRGFIDLGKPKTLDENTIIKSGITKLQTNFGGFVYNKDWTDIYNFKETFTDHKTHCIRQNELTLFYEPIDIIIEQCKLCGFSIYNSVPEDKTIGGILYFFKKLGTLKK